MKVVSAAWKLRTLQCFVSLLLDGMLGGTARPCRTHAACSKQQRWQHPPGHQAVVDLPGVWARARVMRQACLNEVSNACGALGRRNWLAQAPPLRHLPGHQLPDDHTCGQRLRSGDEFACNQGIHHFLSDLQQSRHATQMLSMHDSVQTPVSSSVMLCPCFIRQPITFRKGAPSEYRSTCVSQRWPSSSSARKCEGAW